MFEFRLAQALEQVDLNMNKLAVLADVRPNTINDLVNGKAKRIELETLDKILYALNQASIMKNAGKYFLVQDILQFTTENKEFATLQEEPLMSDDVFLKIRDIFMNDSVGTNISGFENPSILEFLLVYEDHFKAGIYSLPNDNEYESRISTAFLNIEPILKTYGLIEYSKVKGSETYVYRPSEKGKYFLKLLKQNNINTKERRP
ncbi:helix-turn-helix domain-containing protein [Paenibacillus sp. 23TSA30-6]|uniref:helix-turn-helix domain-containing protein n=1 Tax=Paenibacillus sp. 23TSA30-6 TaxID=2546104 RepID=UPI002355F996|nr:helix-turn-helix transcriptional regulator [Paenibacillus sp. 23TSA30-6]MBE0337731.1 XRE family transcriptional regulator [Paenibacillus sp. 23TSA30-6]